MLEKGEIKVRCSIVRKNLSAFLDNELDPQRHKQIELHILGCADCRREAAELREMIGFVRGIERPEVPTGIWEGIQRKLPSTVGRSPVKAFRWAFAPVGVAILALLIFLGSQTIFHRDKTVLDETEFEATSIYLQEYALSQSRQILPVNLLLTVTQVGQSAEKTKNTEPISELEILMEVHYGIRPANGI